MMENLLLCQLLHGIIQCIEQYIDVFLLVLARLLEEGNRIFRIALQRSLIEEDIHVVQQPVSYTHLTLPTKA